MKKIVFEGPVPLSQSSLFTYVRTFYDRLGQEAWSHHGLPTHITCYSGIARSYAALISGWIDDLAAAGWLDRSEPIYVLEIGAGMGRLGYGVVRHYLRTHPLQPMVYVLTDFVPANVDAMQANPGIAEEIAAGRMDAAVFDAFNPAPLQLRHGRRELDPKKLKNPICVIANYVIDSLPTDAFWIKDGATQEALVSLASDDGLMPDWSQRDMIGDIDIKVEYRPCVERRYESGICERVLRNYQHLGDCSINLPFAALNCVDKLQAWSKPDMLLLSGDKAYVALEEMRGHRDFHVAYHASISLMANYHAFELAAPLWGGTAWVSPMRDAGVSYLAMRCRSGGGVRRAFDAAFQREIIDLSPTDKHALTWRTDVAKFDVGDILSLLRVSGDDPLAIGRVGVALCAQAHNVTLRTRDDIARCVRRATDVYLHLTFDEKFPRETAQMLAKLDMPEDLRVFGEAMRKRCGPAVDIGGIMAHAQRMHKIDLNARYTGNDVARELTEMEMIHNEAGELLEKLKSNLR